MNIAAIKRSIGIISDIKQQTPVIHERLRRAEDSFNAAMKELQQTQEIVGALALDLAGHCSTYLYLLQQEEANQQQPKTEDVA